MALCLPSQGQNIIFNHLTTDEGLSQFSVNGLYIDENGVLWIGTREGLNRYNGVDIQTYKLRKNDPYSIFCNSVLRITGNGKGKIYLLCTEGVAEFDMSTEKFTTLIQGGNIGCVYYSNYTNALYIGMGSEIYRYNEKTGNFDLNAQLAGNSPEISCLYRQDDKVWVGTFNDGLYMYKLTSPESARQILKRGNISDIYEDSDGELWVGSWEEGLYRIRPDGSVSNYRNEARNEHSLSSNFVRACCEDNTGRIWIGTFTGLNSFDKQTGLFQRYTADNREDNGLTHSSIWCIEKDQQGTLWLGTYFGGVNYFNPEYEIYTRYTWSETPGQGLSNPVVGRMAEDRNGGLWIATEGGGLNYYDRKRGTFKWYRPEKNNPNSIAHNNVKALYYDGENEIIYIGMHLGGLDRLDIRTGRFTHYPVKEGDPTTLPSDIIRDIEPYGTDSLVVATQNGVCLFSTRDGHCRQLFRDTPEGRRIRMVADVEFDHEGTLWIAATGEGLFSYRFDSKRLTNYRYNANDPHSLSNNNVNNITVDSKGRLWFSTSGSGLDLYHPESDNFENFDHEKNGLSSDCIYMMVESPFSGELLLITNESFSIFDPDEGRFSNYSANNGFPLTAINENALYAASDGEVFLGSTQGMISFHETDLRFTPKPYKIMFSRLFVNSKEVTPGDDTGILSNALYCTPEITLNDKQSMFTIEFSTSNYVAANKDDILYRLEGFSNEWNSTRGTHAVTYTNLNAGTYTLWLKAAGKDETLCPPISMSIRVLPPFYKTPLAYALYVLAIAALLWYVARTYQTRFKLRESLKYEKKHIKDVEALNQSKLRFFTNISHEFRTPLTLIVAQVETLLQVPNFTPGIYNKILSIYKNSLQLRELITELLDFRKQEQGHMKIKVAAHDMVSFLYENYLLFSEYAGTRQITLHFQKDVDALEAWFDQKQMQKVVNNLLSNAVKHTPEGGTITLSISREEDCAVIRVADTGSGIPAGEADHIFDRFYQVDSPEPTTDGSSGTGIGLALTKGIVELHHGNIRVESTLGKGSTFIVRLPLGNSHFAPEQICHTADAMQQADTTQPQEMDLMMKAELEETAPLRRLPDAKILIVEDNKSIRDMLANIFRPFYNVLTAANGQEALDSVRSEMPNIVVSDVVMPRMSGTELCKAIKSDFNTCHIPVVLLTARTAIEQNIEGLRIGADDYITKPFNTTLLISRCNNLVNSRIVLQEKFSKQPQAHAQMLATNPIDKDIMDRAMNAIEKHMDDTEFNVNTLAREMGLARTNLFTKLKAITGQTPNEFILTIRLKRAALLLRNNPELNVTEVSDRIGFSSSRYFSKCFKDFYHVSPLAYRRGEEAEPDNTGTPADSTEGKNTTEA